MTTTIRIIWTYNYRGVFLGGNFSSKRAAMDDLISRFPHEPQPANYVYSRVEYQEDDQ